MIISSGFRGFGVVRRRRPMAVAGFGAFGEDAPPYFLAAPGAAYDPNTQPEYTSYDPGAGTTSPSGGGSTYSWSDIGTGVNQTLTGIANLWSTASRQSTYPAGSGTTPYGQSPQGGLSSTAMVGIGILGLGVLLVVMKK